MSTFDYLDLQSCYPHPEYIGVIYRLKEMWQDPKMVTLAMQIIDALLLRELVHKLEMSEVDFVMKAYDLTEERKDSLWKDFAALYGIQAHMDKVNLVLSMLSFMQILYWFPAPFAARPKNLIGNLEDHSIHFHAHFRWSVVLQNHNVPAVVRHAMETNSMISTQSSKAKGFPAMGYMEKYAYIRSLGS